MWLKLCLIVCTALVRAPAQIGLECSEVRGSLDRGEYATAERLARECRKQTLTRAAVTSPEADRASDLLVESLYRNGRTASGEALELAGQVVGSKERRVPPDPLDLALSLHNLGAVHAARGEFTLSLDPHRKGHALRLRALGPDDPRVADSLDHLASSLIRLERREEARTALDRALAIREAFADRAPLSLAHTLELTAMVRRYAGDYRDALIAADEALSLRRRFSPTHPETASVLHVRGDILYLQGNMRSADDAYREAVVLAENALGPDHPAVAQYLRKVAATQSNVGNLAEARRLKERALRISEAALAECQQELPALFNDLAMSFKYDGEYAEARRLYQRALTIEERCLGPKHSLTATVVHNLAELATEMGDFAEAERLHLRTIRDWSASLGPTHSYVARSLDSLAEVLELSRQRERARLLYQRSLAIRRRTVGPDHPDVAWTLTNLARVKADSGNVSGALRDISQASDIYRRIAGVPDAPDYLGRLLVLRGTIQTRQGDFSSAKTSFAEALSTRQQIFGTAHPLTADARARLASVDFALGDHAGSLSAALNADRSGLEHLRFTVRYLPERQGLAYADKRPKGLDTALSILAADPTQDAVMVLDHVIQSRGVILDELGARSRATAADPALGSLTGELIAARQRFANLMVRSLGESPVPRATLDEARRQKEDAERAVAERSAIAGAELRRANLGLDDIRAALPPGAALVSISRYDRTTFVKDSRGNPAARITPSYLAFVVRAGEDGIRAVPLGGAAAIEDLVAVWRRETTGIVGAATPGDAEAAYRAAGARLRQRIWDPLAAHVKNAAMVFVVPDGALNLVSLAALPVGQQRYLIDQSPVIHYLSAERDLVQIGAPSAAARGLLAVGGAAFDDPTLLGRLPTTRQPAGRATAGAPVTRGPALATGCASWESLKFEPLAGSLREVREIARLWTDPALVLESRNATEREFKQAAVGRRVLHLATHGFFLGSTCAPAITGTRSVGSLATAHAQPKPNENPLLLSGLALAGANRRSGAGPEDEDGILTAEEVAAMNLQGVEWAVLSACDTGLGEVKAGEGVFGLRRAFQVAGVQTVIMSLWSVDDEATRVWMGALYRNRLQKRASTAAAVREASVTVLAERRARRQSTHPFYWAAFVAAGDWR